MKLETIKKRLDPKRPMGSITLRMPADLVADLKQIAPAKGMTGYQALIRAYVGQCLCEDLEKLDDVAMKRFIAKLQAKGRKQKTHCRRDALTGALLTVKALYGDER